MSNNKGKQKDYRAGKPLSEERRIELRAQKLAALQGLSPTAFGDLRARKILEWIWKWGYSTKVIIQILSRTKRHGICDRLVKRGWLAETKTASGLPVKSFFTLTIEGLAEVERHAEKLHKYDFLDPHKVRQNMLRHDLLAQKFTLDNYLKGVIQGYETIYTTRDKSEIGVKQPDVMWLMPDGQKFAIEIELTKKWDRDWDDFRLKVIRALGNDKYDKFYLVTDSKAIKNAYEAGFKPGTLFSTWKKDRHGKWFSDDQLSVPDWIGRGPTGLFSCHLLEAK